MRYIKSSEKKRILEELKEIYGIEKLNYLLIETGKKKIRGFSGHLSKEEITLLVDITNVELIGMYIISKKDNSPRINFDALPIFREQINQSVLKIDEKQLDLWLHEEYLDCIYDQLGIEDDLEFI